MRSLKLAGLSALASVLLPACSIGEESPDGSNPGSQSSPFVAQVAENVVVADAVTAETVELFDDRIELPVEGNERALDLKPGTVFVGAPAQSARAKNTEGFLRRVIRSYRHEDRIVVATTAAGLTDTFVNADIHTLVADEGGTNGVATQGVEGMSLEGTSPGGTRLAPQAVRKAFKGIEVDLAGRPILEQTATLATGPATTEVSAKVYFSKGTLSLSPVIETDVKIRSFKLDKLLVSAEGQLASDVELKAEVTVTSTLDAQAARELAGRTWEVRTPVFTAPPVPMPVQWVAGIPISFGVQFGVDAACSLRFEGPVEATAGAQISGTAKARALYEDGQWKPPAESQFSAKPSFALTTKAGLKGVCELDATATLRLFGVGAAALHIAPYMNLDVKGPELPQNPAFVYAVRLGARGKLQGDFSPFGIGITSRELPLFDWTAPLPLLGTAP